MLTYTRASDLSKLADHLLKVLGENPPDNPLSPEIFVVQNHGMARWLSLHMAEKNGIAANLRFEFPAERIWSLIRILNPDIAQTLPSDRKPMTWAIMEILNNELEGPLEQLQDYIQEDDAKRKEMRKWKLAGRISDVFDQYLTYRPEMPIAWENGRLVTDIKSERWQSVLWRKLIDHWNSHHKEGHKHRAILQNELITSLDEGSLDVGTLPDRISIFGVSTMPPVYLKIFVKLARLTNVHFYVLSPADPVTEPNHPLYDSLGITGIEYRNLLKGLIEEEGVAHSFDNVNDSDSGGKPGNLFRQFKYDLLGRKRNTGDPTYDRSIQVHSCHSTRREVEILHDRILAMLEEDEMLQPSDILVLAPTIEDYIPEIEAVFGSVEENLPALPFNITERNKGHADPVIATVRKLLSLAESRFEVTDVMDLLDTKPIQEHFGFTEDHLRTLQQWIEDNRIRWGIDGTFKADMGLPKSDSFTWQSGLNRMMLGYAMLPDDDLLFNGTYPYREVDGTDDAELAGKFSALMNGLFDFYEKVQVSKSLNDWEKLLNTWLFKFLPEEDEYFGSIQRLQTLIHNFGKYENLSGYRDTLPFRVVRFYLEQELEMKSSRGGRRGQGITFSSLVAMRSIPAKVICLLGMNESEFPGSKLPVSFDLINKKPKPGDRSRSKEDRQLFLESLLAARDRIYVSYIGQSNRQDSDYPPSVVLQELQDYLTGNYGLKEKVLSTKHPLQAFSRKYYQKENPDLFSYSARNLNIADKMMKQAGLNPKFLQAELPEPDPEFRQVTINELIRFFQHPAKYLLQNRFGIYLNHDKILDEDREPFMLSGLESYNLGQELLNRFMDETSLENYKQVAKAVDILPEGWPGEKAYHEKFEQVLQFGNSLREAVKRKKLEPAEIDLEINEFRITGKLHELYENGLVLYRFGRLRSKEHIELWIKHLMLQSLSADCPLETSELYAFDKKKGIETAKLPVRGDHVSILENILNLYWQGLKSNLYFFPDTSFRYAHETLLNNKEEQKALKSAGYKWQNEYTSYPLEGDDSYNKLLMGKSNPLDIKEFKNVSIAFWRPYLDVLIQSESQ